MEKDIFDLSKKVVVLTGAKGLLGREFCKGLAFKGASIALLDIDINFEDSFLDELRLLNPTGLFTAHSCDISSEISVDEAVGNLLEQHSHVDVLINNAASKSSNLDLFFDDFENYQLSQWREIMSVNLDGAFLMSKRVGREMISRNTAGSIIQVSSIYGVVAPDQRIYEGSHFLGRSINTPAVYSVSKAGMISLSNYLSTYWAKHGIRVNTLVPGGIESGQNQRFKDLYSQRVPLGRMAKANEMLGALLFLASDASSYVTGQAIIVDGGLSSW